MDQYVIQRILPNAQYKMTHEICYKSLLMTARNNTIPMYGGRAYDVEQCHRDHQRDEGRQFILYYANVGLTHCLRRERRLINSIPEEFRENQESDQVHHTNDEDFDISYYVYIRFDITDEDEIEIYQLNVEPRCSNKQKIIANAESTFANAESTFANAESTFANAESTFANAESTFAFISIPSMLIGGMLSLIIFAPMSRWLDKCIGLP